MADEGPGGHLPVTAVSQAAGVATAAGDRPPPRRRPRRGRLGRHPWRLGAAVGLLVVVFVLLGFGLWYEGQVGGSPGGTEEVVTVARGASVAQVTATLGRRGVVTSTTAFRLYLFLHGTPVVQPGGYLLHRHQGFATVAAALRSGPDVFPVTVRAGTTVAEVGDELGDIPGHEAADFDRTATSGAVTSPWQPAGSTSLEGLLGTGTYLVLPGETDTQVLSAMVSRFDTQGASAGLNAAAAALGVTPYQALTVASIVQKEAISPGDSAAATAYNVGRVARVIYNRLAAGMPLQDDSTVLYALGRDGGPVTPADLAIDSPYNTYRHAGLTPTPICFPSAQALDAALHPVPGPWLYFVLTQKDGTETFSVTSAQQLAAEALAKSRGLP